MTSPAAAQLDEALMAEALDAAASADFHTSPNPMVAALVVVDGGRIAGAGVHRRAGEAHAEVLALEAAGDAARGATMYVTLEPCVHTGRTPPCAPRIAAAGIARCVVAMLDPNPSVSGRGVALLRSAGVTVDVGVLQQRAARLNEFYVCWVRTGRPFVTAKFAMSLDGRIATAAGESKWITSEQARALVHRLRHAHDALLVGASTVVRDDPNLTTRLPEGGGRQPLRVVLDSRLRVSPTARIFTPPDGHDLASTVLVATSDRARGERVRALEDAGIPVAMFAAVEGRVSMRDLLRHLGRERISVLVEGGSAVHGSAFDDGLVDRVVAFIAPRVIGGVEAPGAVGGRGVDRLADAVDLADVEVTRSGGDIVVSGYVRHAAEGV